MSTTPEFAVPDVVDSPVTSKPPSGRAVRWLLEHRVAPRRHRPGRPRRRLTGETSVNPR
ncbi:hypothetical protein [Amycolatopsis sp. NPDC051128]|uniref:hypothetical protein n=1 Tax=Amycolatopsis sp. NPDC051128 TaxID=3155412 RepID=UPI0034401875